MTPANFDSYQNSPTVVIYCDGGPKRAPHPRFVVAAYQRPHPGLWEPLSTWDGLRMHASECNGDNPAYRPELRIQLWCRSCRLGEKDLPADKYLGPLYAALDDQLGAGEVSVYDLLIAVHALA